MVKKSVSASVKATSRFIIGILREDYPDSRILNFRSKYKDMPIGNFVKLLKFEKECLHPIPEAISIAGSECDRKIIGVKKEIEPRITVEMLPRLYPNSRLLDYDWKDEGLTLDEFVVALNREKEWQSNVQLEPFFLEQYFYDKTSGYLIDVIDGCISPYDDDYKVHRIV